MRETWQWVHKRNEFRLICQHFIVSITSRNRHTEYIVTCTYSLRAGGSLWTSAKTLEQAKEIAEDWAEKQYLMIIEAELIMGGQ